MHMRRPGRRTVAIVLAAVAAVCVVSVRPDDPTPPRSPAPLSRAGALVGASVPGTTTVDPSPAPLTCADVVTQLPVRRRLAQLVMVGLNPADVVHLVRHEQVGGLFISGDDTVSLHDGEIAEARSAAALPLFVAIDEEGGRVQRIPGPYGPLPSARTMATTMSPPQVQGLASSLGTELRGLGVNVDLAPDADVSEQPANAVIGDRSFGNSPPAVITYAGAFAAGLRAAGVLPVFKHFPGHGHAVGDSHSGAAVDPPLSSLLADDLVPYRTLPSAGRSAVMVGHMEVPGLTGSVPASLSPAAYQLLRTTYNFDGVAFTDDLGSMLAVTARYNLSDSVLLALRAGADVALWTTDSQLPQVLDRLTAATVSGELPMDRVNQAVTRVLTAKGVC